MLIVGSNLAKIGKLKWNLHDKFAMKELRQTRDILGMRIARNWKTKTLQLSHLIIPKKCETLQLSDSPTLSDRDSPSTDKERELNGKISYASPIGSIMYMMVATIPDRQ